MASQWLDQSARNYRKYMVIAESSCESELPKKYPIRLSGSGMVKSSFAKGF